MEVDDRVRRLLHDSLTSVDDVTAARQAIERRASRFRRRRRWLRGSAVAGAAAAAAVVATLLWTVRPAADPSPVIAPRPAMSAGTASAPDDPAVTACDTMAVSGRIRDYLNRWTTGQPSLREDQCVLTGRHGPQPQFDTDGLGREQVLLAGDLPANIELPQTVPFRQQAEGYPLVHLGRISGTDNHVFVEWRHGEARAASACVEGACVAEVPGDERGVLGMGRSGSRLGMTVWVSPEASAVSLDIDGEPILWQRPVALIAQLQVDDFRPTTDTTFQVRVFDRRGQQIASYQRQLDS